LTLDELLAGSRPYPLSLSEFRRFMLSQFTDEMVEFLLDARKFKAEVSKVMEREEKERKTKRTSVAVGGDTVEAEVRRLNEEKDRILARYLVAGSEREINLSCDMRTAIELLNLWSYSCTRSPTASLHTSTTASAPPNPRPISTVTCGVPPSALLTLFDPAVREVCELIDQGKFVSRFWHAQTRNIDQHDIRIRCVTGTVCLTLALAITLACLLSSSIRWYRLCAWPFNFYGATTLAIAHCGVCPKLASLRRRIPDSGGKWGWWAVVRGHCVVQCAVADVELMQETEWLVRRMWMEALLVSSVLTAVYVAVPSDSLT